MINKYTFCTNPAPTEKYFLNLVKSNQIYIYNFRLICKQAEFSPIPSKSENGKYKQTLISFKKIQNRFPGVWVRNLNSDLINVDTFIMFINHCNHRK